ncbi:MAG: VWA domain-containing protein [Granulosicoccus sp.]
MIGFEWPWVFILLPAPLLFRGTVRRPDQSLDIPPDLEAALQQLDDHNRQTLKGRLLLLWLAWCLALLSIAQPWLPGDTSAQPVSGRAMALAVDVSASMERQDFELDGIQSDRLSVVKDVARDFVMARNGDRLSLVLFGKEAFIASPLTFDLNALSSILDGAGIGMAGRSTAIGDAIGLAIQTLKDDPAESRAIVLLSDGTNNAGSVEPESAATLARSLNIRLHSIALGSEDGDISGYATAQSADLDEDTLRAVAEATGGAFFRARTRDDLHDVYSAIDKLETAPVPAPPIILRRDLHVWPLTALLGLLIIMSVADRSLGWKLQ